MEMTRAPNNESDKDQGGSVQAPQGRRSNAEDGQDTPILSHTSAASYGSCDEADRESLSKKDPGGSHHPPRHQIGSDVLDFGESSIMWPGPPNHTLPKRPSKKGLSWFGVSEAFTNRSEATLHCNGTHSPAAVSANRIKSPIHSKVRQFSNPPKVSAAPRVKAIDGIEAKPKRHEQRSTTSKGRTVFSLFGLDGSQAMLRVEPDTELDDLTNTMGRPRANAWSAVQPQSDAVKDDDLQSISVLPGAVSDMHRQLSLSRYLDEISRIGANGSQRSRTAPQSIKGRSSPVYADITSTVLETVQKDSGEGHHHGAENPFAEKHTKQDANDGPVPAIPIQGTSSLSLSRPIRPPDLIADPKVADASTSGEAKHRTFTSTIGVASTDSCSVLNKDRIHDSSQTTTAEMASVPVKSKENAHRGSP